MKTITAAAARKLLHRLVAEVLESDEPIRITGARGDAVLVSADVWLGVQETLHLIAVPGMRKSIRGGMKTPSAKCVAKLDW